jgi:hypothetical protein
MTGLQVRVSPRAPRYEVDAPLRFQRPGESDWRHGRTVNASRTGVSFRTMDGGVPPGSALHMELTFSGFARPSSVECTGKVVRCESLDAGLTAIAMTIEVYRFTGDADPPRPTQQRS